MKTGAIMTTRIILSIIFMLLALPSEAMTVHWAVLSGDFLTNVPNLESLEESIRANDEGMDYFFQNGDFRLSSDYEFIIMGGRNSIASELNQYKTRKIILDREDRRLNVYFCFKEKKIGKNTTYIMLRSSLFTGDKLCTASLKVNPSTRGQNFNEIMLGDLAREVEKLKHEKSKKNK